MKKKILFWLIFLLWGTLPAQEGDNNEINDLLKEDPSIEDLLKREVVTASKKSQEIIKAPANVIVVDRETIEDRGYRNLSELLNDLPGFQISTGQPSGEYPSHIMIRGVGDVGQTKLLLLVDGVEQNDVSTQWVQNLGFNFSMMDIERVEVISGPGSSLYGADAYVGIVNVITRSMDSVFNNRDSGMAVEASAAYGLYNTIVPEILLGYRWNSKTAFWLTGRWYYTDGDFGRDRYDPGNYFHNNYEPTTVTTTEYGNLNNLDSNGNPIKLADGFNTSVNDFYFRGKFVLGNFELGGNWWQREEGLGSEVVGYEYFAATQGLPFRAKHMGYTLYTDYTGKVIDNVTSKTKLFFRGSSILPQTEFVYTYKYQSVADGAKVTRDKSKNYHSEGSSIGLDQQFDWDISRDNELTTGLSLERKTQQYMGIGLGAGQDINSSIVSSTYTSEVPSVSPVYYTNEIGIFAQDEHKFSKDYILAGGLRVDYNSEYGFAFNPRASFVMTPGDMLGLKFLYGEAFKAPGVFELLDEWRGNPDLQPEKIRTAEIEVNFFPVKSLLIKGNIFHSRVENLIVVAPNPDQSSPKTSIYQNIGQTNYSGASVTVDFEIIQDLDFFANYTFLLGENLTNEVTGMPSHKVFFGFNYLLLKKININITGVWNGPVKAPSTAYYYYPKTAAKIAEVGYDYVTENNPDGYLDGYFVINLTLTGKNLVKNSRLEPYLIFKNLLNTQYAAMGRQGADGVRPVNSQQPYVQDPVGFIPAYHPQPGFEMLFGVRYEM